MKLHLWGTDFHRSSADFRKQLVFSPEERDEKIKKLLESGFQDVVYLSTCNRVEFYTTVGDYFTDSRPLWIKLLKEFNLPEESFYQGYHLEGKSAVRHLLRVASSLESLVIGESQILGQLKEALSYNRQRDLPIGLSLEHSFMLAFETAKKVRSQTCLGEKSVSVVSLGFDHLRNNQEQTKLEKAVVVGRGSTSISVINLLQKHYPEVPIVWVNRNREVLDKYAEGTRLQKLSLDEFLKAPPSFSHLFTATASREPLFENSFFEKLPSAPVAVYDFAQPPDLGNISLESVEICRLDHLQKEAQLNRELRSQSVVEAEKIIEEALRAHLLSQKEAPVLRDFSQIEGVFEEELQRAYAFIEQDFPIEYQANLKKLAEGIVRKNLHLSREHLRAVLRKVADIGPDPVVI